MAGPPPQEKRRRRNIPARGEWVDLDPLSRRMLPDLPKRNPELGDWSDRTKRAWEAWSQDPVTAEYGPAEIQNAIDLAYLYEEWVRGEGEPNEVRQWLDRLGLNAKGKRDLRFRLRKSDDDEEEEKAPAARKRDSHDGRRARLVAVK